MEVNVETHSDLLQLTSFKLADEEYALDISAVQEIVRMSSVTRVPRAPAFVEGVINLRGKIVPVLDLRKRFKMTPVEPTKATRIIIVEIAGKTVGLLVDAVREVLRLSSDAVEPTPELVTTDVDSAFLRGVGKMGDRLILLLDLSRLLSREEVHALS